MKLITDRKALETAIESIANRGKKLDADIQLAGLSCLNHLEQHGDITMVNRLYLALPQGARKAAMSAWLLNFGKLAANGDATTKKEKPFIFDKTKATDLDGAEETPWFTFKPDAAPDQIFDVVKALHALLAKAAKANAVTGPELLTSVRRMVEEYDESHTVTDPVAE